MEDFERPWREDLRRHYPNWGTPAWEEGWREADPPANVGDSVSGRVIARAGFGVWVEVGVGCPALLLVTEMAAEGPLRFEDYPALGAEVSARVRVVGPHGEVGLTQRSGDSAD